MDKIKAIKAGFAALAMVSASASAEVIYFNDFDGGTMDGVGTGNELASFVGSNNNSDWKIHSAAQANSNISSGMSGNRVGHAGSSFYNDLEQSVYTFRIDATGFELTKLSFNFDSELRDSGTLDIDGASLVAYTGAFDSDVTGDNSYTLLNTNNGEFVYENLGEGRLDNAQFGGGLDRGFNNINNEQGTAMFDLTGLGFDDQIVNFRLAFGSGNTSNSDGIAFDKFKLEGSDCTGSGGSCEPPGGGGIPEPGSLTLAMLGLVGLYGARKKRANV